MNNDNAGWQALIALALVCATLVALAVVIF